MDNKVKLFAVASVVAVLVSGCSGYNNQGSNGSDGYASGGSQSANSGQVGSNGGYGQRRPVANTCAPCAVKPRTTYTYKPKPRVVYKPRPKVVYKPQPKVVYRPQPRVVYKPRPAVQPRPATRHNQQYYIDRWNRQQSQQQVRKPAKPNYSGYGGSYTPVVGASSTTYYDYSTVGKTQYKPPSKPRNLSVSKKGIYTGAYQKKTYKPYKPVTYTGGTYNQATTKTIYSGRTAARTSSVARGGSRYVVKKGDTVFEIMRQTGVYWKDIIRLNNLQKPYSINPGQSIRLK